VRGGIGTLLLLIALAIGSYGVWLIATVDAEFKPRGSVGVVCMAAAVALAASSWFALRRR
jgi:hypothetical protein